MRSIPLVLLNINRTSKDGLFSFKTEAKKKSVRESGNSRDTQSNMFGDLLREKTCYTFES